jgi:hypothetical protein
MEKQDVLSHVTATTKYIGLYKFETIDFVRTAQQSLLEVWAAFKTSINL